MRITPLDIQQKQFSSRLKGFDMEEVDSFLELIREEMEELLRENANLREETKRYEKQLKEYKNTAKKDAELLRKEAEMRAEDILRDAQQQVVKIHEDITDLKGIRRHFKEEVKRLIESHLRMMEFDKEREEEKPDEV
jgi:cell division initiation protein